MSKTETILLAEDDPSVIKYLSVALKKNGYEPLEAANGQEAIDIITNNNSIDAIISDIDMPLVDGLSLARHNSEHRRLPFVVSTKISDSRLALTFLEFGVRDYLEKPVTENKIVSVLKNALLRRSYRNSGEQAGNYEGNISHITIPSKISELAGALNWAKGQTSEIFNEFEIEKFLDYLHEFLLNAHEHGNLGISEEEKSELVESERLQSEIERRESLTEAKITIAISVLNEEVAIQIDDEGKGFDYTKYLMMSHKDLLNRLSMPNGRGVYMSKSYFDSIEYSNKGSQVRLRKTTGPQSAILRE